MLLKHRIAAVLLIGAAPGLVLAGHIVQTNLVSDLPGISNHPPDANLVNSWGIVHGPATPWWVADNGTGVTTLYTGQGVKVPLTVTIPPPAGSPAGTTSAPTGVI